MIADTEAHACRNGRGFANGLGRLPAREVTFDEGHLEARCELHRHARTKLEPEHDLGTEAPPRTEDPLGVRNAETACLEKAAFDERTRIHESDRAESRTIGARAHARGREMHGDVVRRPEKIVAEVAERETERRPRRSRRNGTHRRTDVSSEA